MKFKVSRGAICLELIFPIYISTFGFIDHTLKFATRVTNANLIERCQVFIIRRVCDELRN